MGSLEDFQGFGEQLQTELDQLDTHRDADRPHIKRFVQYHDPRVSEGTLREYLKNLRMTSQRIDRPLVELDAPAVDEHVYDLRHNSAYGRGSDDGLADTTVYNIQFAIRKFCRFASDDVDGLEWADEYDLISQERPSVSPDEMLDADDIAALCDGANNLRDIAIIEFLADTGARISMLGSLRVGDVDLDGDTATFTPNPNAKGLKGAAIREYPIIDARATLRTYLRSTHPRPDDDDVAFFHRMAGHGNDFDADDAGALSPSTIHGQLRRAADNAGLDKPVNPHNFRHSAVSRMRREGYTRSQIEHRCSWEVDTDMWAIYEHISAEQHNDDIFRQAGIVADDGEAPEQTRAACGNCRETLAPHHTFCPRCGAPADPSVREAVDTTTEAARDELVTTDTRDERLTIAEMAEAASADPDVAERLVERLEALDD